jgi:hypothetical protein
MPLGGGVIIDCEMLVYPSSIWLCSSKRAPQGFIDSKKIKLPHVKERSIQNSSKHKGSFDKLSCLQD